MIELLLVQTITNLALAAVVIKLRRELWPMTAAAQPMVQGGFWLRSVDVLVLDGPQFETAKVVTKVRWLFTEELFLRRRFRVYVLPMRPSSRGFYKQWKAWLRGDDRYRCLEEKPRGLSRLYNKAIDVVCYDMENERDRKLWAPIEIALAGRRRQKHKT